MFFVVVELCVFVKAVDMYYEVFNTKSKVYPTALFYFANK